MSNLRKGTLWNDRGKITAFTAPPLATWTRGKGATTGGMDANIASLGYVASLVASLPRTTAFAARRFIHLFAELGLASSGVVLTSQTAPSTCRIFNGAIELLNEQHRESTVMSSPRWRPGESGNPGGRRPGSRNRLNEEVISSFLRDWRVHGDHALAEVRRTQPAVYCKLAVLLVPREQKVEHVNAVSGLSDEQLAAMIADLEERIASRLQGRDARVIDAQAEPALPLPVQPAGDSWKCNPKSSPERLAKAREYMRRRRAAAKATKGE